MKLTRTRTLQATLALLLLMAMQGPLALLQVVAWGGMLVNYSREGSFIVAVERTFNGENPCALCTQLNDVREQEGSSNALLQAGSRALLLLWPTTHGTSVQPPQSITQAWTPWSAKFSDWKAAIETPPPRLVS